MRRKILIFLLSAYLFMVSACSSTIDGYQANLPRFIPEQYFQGELSAHGVVKNFRGKVIRYFNATIEASWQDGIGTLREDFIFDDGEKQQRTWTITPAAQRGRYLGTAPDVTGKASIRVSGNAMFLRYVLQIPRNNGTINVVVDDRMYLTNDKVLINESKLYKWGLPVGSVLLTIVR